MTKAEIIARLEQELAEQRQRNEQLSQELYSLKNQSDIDFSNSILYKQMQADLDKYKTYKALYEDVKKKRNAEKKEYKILYEKYQKLISDTYNLTKHNARGAGRKSKITDTDKELIKLERASGATLQALASKYGYSFGSIQAICKGK